MPHTTRLYVLALISACLLVVFVTRHGWPSVHQGKHIIETTSRELQQVVIPVELNLTLAEYLESKNVNHGTPIFTTIITENYSPAVDTFISTIRSFGMGHTVLVVCVFEGCTRYFAHTGHANLLVYDGFYRQEQAVFQSTTGTVDQRQLARFGLLPRIKFDLLVELSEARYPHVFFEGDCYLRENPFYHMRPLAEPGWDIQYQQDAMAHIMNFGWFFVRANELTTSFWKVIRERHLKDPRKWDQEMVHVVIQEQLEKVEATETSDPWYRNGTEGVQMKPLARRAFYGWHLGTYPLFNPVMNHLTAVWAPLRFWIAKESGWVGDINHYYSIPPKRILTSPPMWGTISQVWLQCRLLMVLAKATGATFMPPTSLAIIRMDNYLASGQRIVHRPFSRFLPIGKILQDQHVELVEPRYLDHAAKYLPEKTLEKYKTLRRSLNYQDYPEVGKLLAHLLKLIESGQWGEEGTPVIEIDQWHHSTAARWKEDNVCDALKATSAGRDIQNSGCNFKLYQPCATWQRLSAHLPEHWCGPNDMLMKVVD